MSVTALRRRRRLPAPARPRTARAPARALDRVLRAAGEPLAAGAFVRRRLAFAAAAAGVGALWIGGAGAVIAPAGAAAWTAVDLRRRIGARAHRVDDELPSLCESLAAAIRAGASLPLALRDAECEPPLRDAVDAAVAHFDVGGSVRDALDRLADVAGTEQSRRLVRALGIAHRAGAELPAVLDHVAESGRDRVRAAREARAAAAQTRMSAWVVASLPVVFLVMTTTTSRAQADLLLRTPAGWGLLGAGALLEGAGLLWIRKVSR